MNGSLVGDQGTGTDRLGQPDSPRERWPALPRRSGRRTTGGLLAIRTPIPRRARWALAAASMLVPLAVWVALVATGSVPSSFLPGPGAVWSAGVEMARSGELFTDLWATTWRVMIGFGLAVLVSVPIGIVMGTFAAGEAVFEPVIGLLRYLPASAFVPLLIIWLGIDEASKIAILFLGTVFFNTLMTADVVRGVPSALIDVSYTLGASRLEVLRKVIIPYSLPGIIDTIRVNVAVAWNLVVISELVASTVGLGYRIVRAQRFLQTDKIFAVLIVIALLGLLLDVALRMLRARVGRWVG